MMTPFALISERNYGQTSQVMMSSGRVSHTEWHHHVLCVTLRRMSTHFEICSLISVMSELTWGGAAGMCLFVCLFVCLLVQWVHSLQHLLQLPAVTLFSSCSVSEEFRLFVTEPTLRAPNNFFLFKPLLQTEKTETSLSSHLFVHTDFFVKRAKL